MYVSLCVAEMHPLLYCVSVVLCVELCEPPPDDQVVQVNRPILGSNVQV